MIFQLTWTDKYGGKHRRCYVSEDYARQHARRLLDGTSRSKGVIESTIRLTRYIEDGDLEYPW